MVESSSVLKPYREDPSSEEMMKKIGVDNPDDPGYREYTAEKSMTDEQKRLSEMRNRMIEGLRERGIDSGYLFKEKDERAKTDMRVFGKLGDHEISLYTAVDDDKEGSDRFSNVISFIITLPDGQRVDFRYRSQEDGENYELRCKFLDKFYDVALDKDKERVLVRKDREKHEEWKETKAKEFLRDLL